MSILTRPTRPGAAPSKAAAGNPSGLVARYMAAAVQFEPEFANKSQNLADLSRLVREAGLAGARLAVLPEMATTGYRFRGRREIAPLVEPVPGPTTEHFGELARQFNLYIVVGLPEVDPETEIFYNCAALIGPSGDVIGKYRKTHSFIDETRWACDGNLGIPVFSTELGRIALLICQDLSVMETARVAALKGADLIAFPTNWLGSPNAWQARALENGVYVIAADRWGEERGARFVGESRIIDPQGRSLALLSKGNGLALGQVEPERARDKLHPVLGDRWAARRPEQYHSILIHHYLWHPDGAQELPPGGDPVLAVCQFEPHHTDPEPNLVAMEALAARAAAAARQLYGQGPDLLVFPELALGGPGAAQSLRGPAAQRLTALAKAHGCHLVLGLAEAENGRRYNTALLVGPAGVAGRYRQVHLSPDDALWADPGDEFSVFDLPWGRIGMLLGTDLYLPESSRIVAKHGAEVLAVPARWPGHSDRSLLLDRARGDCVALAFCNNGGASQGGSLLAAVSRAGEPVRAELAAGEGVAVQQAATGPGSTVRNKELLRRLQPQWYEPILTSPL